LRILSYFWKIESVDGFSASLRTFENINGIFGFFLVFWEKFAEKIFPGSTGKIWILEEF
jgi:hypothetical protein